MAIKKIDDAHLIAIADAIREKNGTATTYKPSEMAAAIAAIESGGGEPEAVIKSLAVMENGTYTAPDGVDGYSPVTVNVPIPDGYIKPSGELEVTENGIYDVIDKESVNVAVPDREVVLQRKIVTPTKSTQTIVADAESGYDGLLAVQVEAIPDEYIVPSGTKTITENGTHDVTENAFVSVEVPDRDVILQDKTITENGTYSADEGYDGLGHVTVNVESPGGGGGEVNMGTCTIKITVPSSTNYYSAYEQVTSGAISYAINRNYTSGTFTKTVRCDSVMYIQGSTVKGVTVADGELLKLASGYGIAYKTPSTAGVTVQITLTA